jgi:hypothetical protein
MAFLSCGYGQNPLVILFYELDPLIKGTVPAFTVSEAESGTLKALS